MLPSCRSIASLAFPRAAKPPAVAATPKAKAAVEHVPGGRSGTQHSSRHVSISALADDPWSPVADEQPAGTPIVASLRSGVKYHVQQQENDEKPTGRTTSRRCFARNSNSYSPDHL